MDRAPAGGAVTAGPLLGAAWAALAWAALARHRPAPARVRAIVPAAGRPTRGPDPLAAVGRIVLGRASRLPRRWTQEGPTPIAAPPPESDRTGSARATGAITVALVISLLVAPPLALAVGGAAWALPRHRARAEARERLRALEADLPEVVDLLVLAVGAGCNVTLALEAVGARAGSGPLAHQLRQVSADAARGRRLADRLDELPAAAGEPVRILVGPLVAAERYGTPLLPALQRVADEVRLRRQRQAEAAARKVPVALLFPLVLCILPAFALLTVAPLIAGALRELRL
jgi:hypothetical protein